MFKQADVDTIGGIEIAVSFYTAGFADLHKEEGAQDSVERYRPRAELALNAIDKAMQELLLARENNDGLLVNWAARVKSCVRMLDTLDKNLAFKGKRQWNWEEVVQAMSFLEAVLKGAKLTLWVNGVEGEF